MKGCPHQKSSLESGEGSRPMHIVFIGTSELGIPSLRALKERTAHDIAVISKPDQVGGRGNRVIAPPLKLAAQELGLDCMQPVDVNSEEIIGFVREFEADLIVTASFWARLSRELLAAPRFGGLNIHPSLLPRYRGAAPVQHAILNNDAVTGVTIFQMRERMDAGEILGREETPISGDDDFPSLHNKLANAAAPLLLRVLDEIEHGSMSPVPQDDSDAVMAPKLKREDGRIDWRSSAAHIERLVRAMVPWPGAYTFVRHRRSFVRIIITKSRCTESVDSTASAPEPGEIVESGKRLIVACSEGFLDVLRLKREGKNELPTEEFTKGMHFEPGTRFVRGEK